MKTWLFASVGLSCAWCMSGCDNLSRSLGAFAVTSRFNQSELGPDSYPLDADLYVPALNKVGAVECGKAIPLVRVAYRDPMNGKVVNSPGEGKTGQQSYYMVIDVAALVRDPSLGVGDPGTDEDKKSLYRKRLRAVAELLVTAADWNGGVYWRHFTTFMSYYAAGTASARALAGAGIAATFISPVVGASLAGAGLALDTGLRDLTENFDIHNYTAIRDAASLYRTAKRAEIWAIVDADYSEHAVSDMLRLADDYAYTYSLKGAIQGTVQTNEELKQKLLTGKSAWDDLLQPEIQRLNHVAATAKQAMAQDEQKTQQELQKSLAEQLKTTQAQQQLDAAKAAAAPSTTPTGAQSPR